MFLAVNIGNTNVQMGLFANKKLVCCIVFPTSKKPANNYYKAVLENLSQFKMGHTRSGCFPRQGIRADSTARFRRF